MRILYITERVTEHDRRFHRTIIAAGHEAVVYSLAAETGSETANSEDVSTPSLSMMRLRALADEGSFDVVHAGPLTTSGFVAAEAGLSPLVTCSWAYDVLRDAANSENERHRARVALAGSVGVIVDSLVVEQAIRSEFSYAGRITRFPWGVDLDIFRPAAFTVTESGGSADSSGVICTRAWEVPYRIELVIDAFALAAGQDPDLRLVLAGDGSQAAVIRARIAHHSITKLVRLPGHVPEADLAALMRASNIFVSASPVDGASVSLLQAMASGLLTVCSDIPGNREWVQDGPGSRLIVEPDPIHWADAIVEATHLDPAIADRVRSRNRQVAERHADWTINSRSLEEAYESAISA